MSKPGHKHHKAAHHPARPGSPPGAHQAKPSVPPRQAGQPAMAQLVPAPTPIPPAAVTQSSAGCLVRVYWMFVGNALIGSSAIVIAKNRDGLFSWGDIILPLAAISVIVARYYDVARFRGLTATGKQATPSQWRRYAVIISAVAIVLWIAAHLLAWRL